MLWRCFAFKVVCAVPEEPCVEDVDVDVDAIGEEQKVKLEVAKIIREDFLMQNGPNLTIHISRARTLTGTRAGSHRHNHAHRQT